MLYATAALALVSLAAIPVARGANFNVTVGGPGILAFAPDQVVSIDSELVLLFPFLFAKLVLIVVSFLERSTWRHHYVHLSTKEPHRDPVNPPRPMHSARFRIRLGIVSDNLHGLAIRSCNDIFFQ
jgi:hypothetical protein